MFTLRRFILYSVSATLLSTTVTATSAKDLSKRFDELSQQVNRTRGLALSILKQIKQIDRECRDENGYPIDSRTTDAQDQLSRVRLLVSSFETNSDEAEKSLAIISRKLSKLSSDDSLVIRLGPELDKIEADIKKHRKYVKRYYQKSISDFGEKSPDEMTMVSLDPGEKLSISGEVTAGLGSSRYKRPNASPGFKASATDISFGVKGRYIPAKRTNILANLDHKTTVQRREIGLTRFGASVVQNLSAKATGSAGFDYLKYSDKENDLADFNDFGMFAKFDYDTNGKQFGLKAKRVKRSYSNVDAEYTTTDLSSRGVLPIGRGYVRLQVDYFEKSNEIEFLDHREFNPSLLWKLSPAGTEMGFSYQDFSHPNQDNSAADNNRLKAHIHFVSKSGGQSSRWGPEVMIYKFTHAALV